MSSLLPLYGRYALFAGVAIAVNLGTQVLALLIYQGPLSLTVSIAAGTGTGLVTKYLLDKRWVFFDKTTGAAANGWAFALYAGTGIVTTAIFWGFEYGFNALTPDGRWRFLGAAIGLSIGYVVKYQLDRRFVFNRSLP